MGGCIDVRFMEGLVDHFTMMVFLLQLAEPRV